MLFHTRFFNITYVYPDSVLCKRSETTSDCEEQSVDVVN